jgi:Tol biopolymer transport system component
MRKAAIFLILPVILAASVFADTTSPSNKEAEQHFEKANELLKRMDYEGAIAEYSKVVNLSSGSKAAQDAQYWIGQSQFRAGRLDDAQATFAKLIEQYPSSTIIPVTKLMVERVEQAKKNEAKRMALSITPDNGFIIDPNTGVKYTKSTIFTGKIYGKNDMIDYTTDLNISPNSKFLLCGKLVVPTDGSEPFELVETPAYRGTWSPDGKKVAFYSGDAICVVPVSPETGRATGPVKKLLDGEYNFQPNVGWSPDSEKLAFMRGPDREKGIYGGDIWTLSVKDGSLTQITSDRNAREGAPAWSPDGKTIAYGKRIGRIYSLWVISAQGGEPTEISTPGGRGFRFKLIPHWSPDGKWILCPESDTIRLFDIDNNRKFKVVLPRGVGRFFDWSSDGKKILFYRPSYDYLLGLKIVSSSGGLPLDVAGRIPCYGTAMWSADSKILAVQGGDENGNIVIWIMPLSDHNPVPVNMDVAVGGRPFPFSVSPGAKRIAFVVDRKDGTQDLFVVPISLQYARTTGPAVKIFDRWYREGAFNVMTSWSPDGNKLAVIHRRDIWIAFCDGDRPVRVTQTPEMEIWPGWSPDGTMITYKGPGERFYYIKSASGGKATEMAGVEPPHTWSLDSKNIAFVSNGCISITPLGGGEIKEIAKLDDMGFDRLFDMCWSPDGKKIACVGNHVEKGDTGPIFVIPAKGGQATMLATSDNSSKYSLSWSPDGKWIAYSSERTVKVRPEGTMWEADFDEIVKKPSR